MALYNPHSIFHLAQLLYVRPETFGPYYAPCVDGTYSFLVSNLSVRKALYWTIYVKDYFKSTHLKVTMVTGSLSRG